MRMSPKAGLGPASGGDRGDGGRVAGEDGPASQHLATMPSQVSKTGEGAPVAAEIGPDIPDPVELGGVDGGRFSSDTVSGMTRAPAPCQPAPEPDPCADLHSHPHLIVPDDRG